MISINNELVVIVYMMNMEVLIYICSRGSNVVIVYSLFMMLCIFDNIVGILFLIGYCYCY